MGQAGTVPLTPAHADKSHGQRRRVNPSLRKVTGFATVPASPPSLTESSHSGWHFCPKQASDHATSSDAIFQTPRRKESWMSGEAVILTSG